MRFFTREWHGGDISAADARRVVAQYEAHLAAFGSHLPSAALRLQFEVSLHDGLLRAVERTANRFEMVVRAGDNRSGYFDARLSYDDASVSASDERFLAAAVGLPERELLYDEFDAAGTQWVHRFLFWPYHDVSVRFAALTLAVTPVPERFDTEEERRRQSPRAGEGR